MNAPTVCPRCQSPLPPDAPAGLCLNCLVAAGFESQAPGELGGAATASTSQSSRFVPPAVDELAPRFPQLEILEFVGKGGMGAVYKARQKGLDRLVAVKILPPEVGQDPTFAERFTREARAMARLNHPNIVVIHDFGQTDGLFYFVMEYVDGANLRQAMQARRLGPAEALAIIPQICDALQFAHDEGVVHRDIKPENILLDRKGRVKIADFGLSKLLRKEPADVSLTGTQQVMGTVRYMAPEQMQGTKGVDHRADIYSLGVVFYELLTGDVPMGRFDPPSRKVQLDVRLDEVVLRALESEPARRYQQASDVKTDVEAVQNTSRGVPSSGPLKPFAGMAAGEVARERFVPEALDKPEVSPWRKWSGAAIGLVLYAAFSLLIHRYLRIGSIVAFALAIPAILMLGTIAYKHYGTRRARPALFVLSMFAFVFVGMPLISVLSNPQPTLNRIYEVTGIQPGADDAFVLQIVFLLLVFGGLFSLIAYWLKLRKEARGKSIREDTSTGLPAPGEHPLMAALRFWMTPQGPIYVRRVGAPLLILTALLIVVGVTVSLAVPPETEWVHMLTIMGGGMLLAIAVLALHLWWAIKGRHMPSAVSPAALAPEEASRNAEGIAGRGRGLGELAAVVLGLGILVPLLLFIFTGDLWLAKPSLMIGMLLAMLLGLISFCNPLGRHAMLLAVVVFGAYSAVQIYITYRQMPITYPWFGDTGFVSTPEGPALSDVLARKLGIRAPQQKEASRIFQDYYRQYVSLERRHTKHSVDDRVRITMEPFPGEMHELVTRLSEELAGVVDQRIAPPVPEKGKVHAQLGLFRFAGEATVTAELWKEDHGAGQDSYFYIF
jgi:predicted Ser/Thr protein kinase